MCVDQAKNNKESYIPMLKKLYRIKSYILQNKFGFMDQNQLGDYLKEKNISIIEKHSHPAVFTMKDMEEHLKLKEAPLIKNLFYSDKKKDCYLLFALMDTKVGKEFWRSLSINPGNVRLASEERMAEVLKVKKGMVGPFGLLNDSEKKIKKVIVDQRLLAHPTWAFHPNDNTQTWEISQAVFKNEFMALTGKTLTEMDLEQGNVEGGVKEAAPKVEKKKVEKKKKEIDENETKLQLEYKLKDNFSEWYRQVIIKAELIDYYEVSGCYILRPWAYAIWEYIQGELDRRIKTKGVKNCYFPMFVTEKALNTEKDHVEGFAAEVAWVTRQGTTDLKEPIAIRPTSETIMYPAFKKWINSHRDLPLLLNQWSNVVRWEFKHPTPFLRTREFLWQEGHTAHQTHEQAKTFVFDILEFYRQIFEDVLAVPVIKGIKSENEKFAGGAMTTTVEGVIPHNCRGIQGATSHDLGQNFGKMFDVTFNDEKGDKSFVWQTSWGLTTRTIGVMIMTHGDDKGIILPPKVAQYQVVIVPLYFKDTAQNNKVDDKCFELKAALEAKGVRTHVDNRDVYTPGWKYNDWEMKGVPVRLELGPKDFQNQEVRVVIRYNAEKYQCKQENLPEHMATLMLDIQSGMFKNACEKATACYATAHSWTDFMTELNKPRIVETPWCKQGGCEDIVKEKSGAESKMDEDATLTGSAKTLCIPLEQKALGEDAKCFHCGEKAECWVLWGRSY